MLNGSRFRAISENVFAKASGYEVELVGVSHQEGLARFGNNQISQHVDSADDELVIRVQKGKRLGRAACNQMDPRTLEQTVQKAIRIAESQLEQPDLLELPSPQRYQTLDHFVERTVRITPAEKIEQVQEVVARCRAEKLTAAGIFSHGLQHIGIANSKGLFTFGGYTTASFSLTVMATDSSGWAEATHRDIREIRPNELASVAIEKALQSRRPKSVDPGRYTVVLEPAAVAELLLFMAWDAFGALPYQEGRSFLSGKMGNRLLDERVTLVDDAYHPKTIGLPFDFEGMPRKRVTLIEKGTARGVVHDRKTARKEGAESTGHALPQPNTYGPMPMNLVMNGGDKSLSEMIINTERGLLITHFHYTNLIEPTNLTITGMTRDGIFWIEQGKIKHPVKNFRFTESVVEAFNRIEAVGRETVYAHSFWGSGIVAPAIKIRDFHFSSGTLF
jgi:predicted Zn-dependent protease